tara:strand:+ start:1087 stop:2475 length:1389 start_codon:yes stop_codon:yes gene_type:complete
MILMRNGVDVSFISEDSTNVTPYFCFYLSGDQVGGLFQFKHHNTVIDIFRKSSFFTDDLGNPFNDTTLQEFIDALYDVSYLPEITGLVYVAKKSNFPSPVGGVITLKEEYTYEVLRHIDLTGDRLVCGDDTTILGKSSENCSITSTGLGVGIALITSLYTVPIRHITFEDVDTVLDFDGTGTTMALDWTGVNFENIPNVGIINNPSNIIFSKGAFINSKGLKITGIFNTVGIDNSIFTGDGLAGNIIEVPTLTEATRRFRIIYSAVVCFGSTVGLNISDTAIIQDEGYLLDTVNFSGGGTYLSGIDFEDNRALFRNCRGVSNSSEVSSYYMNGNATATTITTVGTPVKVEGATTSAPITQKFTNTDNRATYNGALSRVFKITVTSTLSSGNNKYISGYIYKNGIQVNGSRSDITTSGVGDAENIVTQCVVFIETGDYFEYWIEQNSNPAQDIIIVNLNLIIN